MTYKILWFEDTDESYNTLSRRTKTYVEQKHLKCQIDRIKRIGDYDLSNYDLNTFEILVVDLTLSSNGTIISGTEVIEGIRKNKYVNDILFYSASGVKELQGILAQHQLEGVFISDRDNDLFMSIIKRLIDKSVRRSENMVSIRGIVMDETSEFDNQMKDIIRSLNSMLPDLERKSIQQYIDKLLREMVKDAEGLTQKYTPCDEAMFEGIIDEDGFTSMMKAKVLQKILNIPSIKSRADIQRILAEGFSDYSPDHTFCFVEVYKRDVLVFRNHLAHVKQCGNKSEAVICKIGEIEYRCNEDFCMMMRETLIRYGKVFGSLHIS